MNNSENLVYVKSENINLDKTPNQILKFIIYKLVDMNERLYERSEKLSNVLKSAEELLLDIYDSCKCDYCEMWFHIDSGFRCDICKSFHCGECKNKIKCTKCTKYFCYDVCEFKESIRLSFENNNCKKCYHD